MPNPSTAQVRQWARSHGYAVGDRGRLSPNLVAAYLADQRRSGSRPDDNDGRAAVPSAPGSEAEPARRVVRAKSPWNWPQLEQERRGRG